MGQFCSNCGNIVDENGNCGSCGQKNEDVYSDVKVEVVESVLGEEKRTTTQKQGNGLAIAGFVVSLVSILCCIIGPICAPVALILSIVALKKSKELDEEGKGFAIAGIVISSVSIVFAIFNVVCTFMGVLGGFLETL